MFNEVIFKFSYINVKLFSIYIFCKKGIEFPKKYVILFLEKDMIL